MGKRMRVVSVEYIYNDYQKTIEPLKFEKIIIHIVTEDNKHPRDRDGW